jgi:hypothetical protein
MKYAMKYVALAALAAQSIVKAQRLSDVSCNSTTCSNGGTCKPTLALSESGFTCAVQTAFGGTYDLAGCAAAVSASSGCSNTFIFGATAGACACVPSGMTCGELTDVSGGSSTLSDGVVYYVEDPYCSCVSAAVDGSDAIFQGETCTEEVVFADDDRREYARMLNVVTDVANSGELEAAASALSVAELGADLFDHVTVQSAAHVLHRGVDGDMFIDVSLHRDAYDENADKWEQVFIDSLVAVLADYGFTPDVGQFRFIGGDDPDFETTRTACFCKTISTDGFVCDPTPQTNVVETYYTGANASTVEPVTTVVAVLDTARCVTYSLVLYIAEDRLLYDFELALIISACIVLVCGLGIGLSFTKQSTPLATAGGGGAAAAAKATPVGAAEVLPVRGCCLRRGVSVWVSVCVMSMRVGSVRASMTHVHVRTHEQRGARRRWTSEPLLCVARASATPHEQLSSLLFSHETRGVRDITAV